MTELYLNWFRAHGWVVAVHNEYRLNGDVHAFWLWTKPLQDGGLMLAAKGEGFTNQIALEQAMFVVLRHIYGADLGRVEELYTAMQPVERLVIKRSLRIGNEISCDVLVKRATERGYPALLSARVLKAAFPGRE